MAEVKISENERKTLVFITFRIGKDLCPLQKEVRN
jgi:hypothetical protein